MKEDTKRLMRAFREVYLDFRILMELSGKDYAIGKDESMRLFEIAWNDSMLGEVLREEVLERYQQILHAEQVKREIEEEAEAGEAMII